MRKKLTRALALSALALLAVLVPACTTYDEYGYDGGGDVSVGIAVYGGYYGPGYGGCCYGPPGGVIVAPPIHGGSIGGPHVSPR